MANLEIDTLRQKKIAILGYGVEGSALANFLRSHKVENILIFDENASALENVDSVFECTSDSTKLNEFAPEIVFRSPGFQYKKAAELLPNAFITSGTDLFLSLKKGTVIGITGTKGKSTTANLIYAILKANGEKVFLGGNIGNSPLDFVGELDERSYTIMELSSFQLQEMKNYPEIAIILPISSDHLNYHESIEEYRQAKMNIIAPEGQEQIVVMPYDLREQVPSDDKKKIVSYSLDNQASDCHLTSTDFICRENKITEDFLSLAKKLATPPINLASVASFCFITGREFNFAKFVPHFNKPDFRMQLVKEKDSLKFFNDSAATNPISTIEAVNLSQDDFILICGGSNKGLEYGELGKILAQNNLFKKVYLFGEVAPEMERDFLSSGVIGDRIVHKETLEDVMRTISQENISVGSIIFSPSAASFDQFSNYKERGERFNDLVKKWPNI